MSDHDEDDDPDGIPDTVKGDPADSLEAELAEAVDNEDIDTIRDLLEIDADIAHTELEDGFTPWEMVKGTVNEEVVQVFLDAGIDIDWTDGQNRCLAYFCAEDGHIETLEILARLGAQLDIPDIDGNTPLDAALLQKKAETVGFLVSQGCEWNRAWLQKLTSPDARACRDILLVDLARREAQDAADTLARPAP